MLSTSVLSYRMVRNDWSRVKAETLAEAAINRTILALTDARAEKRCRIDGVPQDLAFGSTHVTVRVQDEFGKIDLNAADGTVFKSLLELAGVPFEDADKLAARIVDWRTPYEEKERDNAKPINDETASTGYRPRNAAFQSVDELKLVAGMTPQIFARIAPALTVYSKQLEIDQDVAPREALLRFLAWTRAKRMRSSQRDSIPRAHFLLTTRGHIMAFSTWQPHQTGGCFPSSRKCTARTGA